MKQQQIELLEKSLLVQLAELQQLSDTLQITAASAQSAAQSEVEAQLQNSKPRAPGSMASLKTPSCARAASLTTRAA